MECPYINNNFSECSRTLNIQNLSNAFELCTNHYQQCPVYRKLRNTRLTDDSVSLDDHRIPVKCNALSHSAL